MGERKILNTGPSPRGWHRLQSVLECPQKYAYQHELGLAAMDSTAPPLIKGSMMHLALAQHYNRMKNEGLGLDVDEWEEPEAAVIKQAEVEQGWDEYVEMILDCYRAYIAHYTDEPFKVLEVEQLAYTQIFDKYLFTGRFDMVVEDRGGRVWVVDHKTTTESWHVRPSTMGSAVNWSGMPIWERRSMGIALPECFSIRFSTQANMLSSVYGCHLLPI